jgi:membrane-associated protease RseP (regulator of RpoE activity)
MILLFGISLILCIVIHELAHFIAAKLVKCKVEEFGIGFGSAIFKIVYKGTIYRLNWILLGGYNKLASEISYSRNKYAFTNLKYRNKVFIALAGVGINIIVGILSYLIGKYSMNHKLIEFGFINMFFGIMNLMLGITNLIPFPALDGSYPFLVWLEKLYGKKRGYDLMNNIVKKGIIILNDFNKITIIVLIVLYRTQIVSYIILNLKIIISTLEKIKKVL